MSGACSDGKPRIRERNASGCLSAIPSPPLRCSRPSRGRAWHTAVSSSAYNRRNPVFDNPAMAWVAVAIVAAIVEVSIPHFGVIFVSLAAAGGAIAALLGFGLAVQAGAFAVVLVVSL